METKAAETAIPDKSAQASGLRVVAIGGGTGLSTLLKGLKRFVQTPTEIVQGKSSSPVIRDLCAVDGERRWRLQRTPSKGAEHAPARGRAELHCGA